MLLRRAAGRRRGGTGAGHGRRVGRARAHAGRLRAWRRRRDTSACSAAGAAGARASLRRRAGALPRTGHTARVVTRRLSSHLGLLQPALLFVVCCWPSRCAVHILQVRGLLPCLAACPRAAGRQLQGTGFVFFLLGSAQSRPLKLCWSTHSGGARLRRRGKRGGGGCPGGWPAGGGVR